MSLENSVAAAATGAPRTEPRCLRILIISSDTFPPTRVDVSVLFGEELGSRGHQIDFILQSERECKKSFVARFGNGSVWVGPTDLGDTLLHRIHKHFLSVTHDLKVFALLRRRRYDIVQVKDKFLSGVIALIAARMARTPFVYWLSFPFPEAYLHEAAEGIARYPLLARARGAVFRFLLYRILLRAASHVFVQSEQMRRDIAAHGIAITNLTPVPMGIKLDYVSRSLAIDKRICIPPTERSFLYLGEISRSRRMDFLIRVLAKVRETIPTVSLYLVGGGDAEDLRSLANEAARLGVLSAVKFVGQLSRDEAFEYVLDADVCVSPIFPNLVFKPASPTKLVEYMALGKPVVANDHPDQRFVIEQSGGGLCVPWDEQAFADAVIRLISAPDEAKTMGNRGRLWVASNRAYPVIADAVEREYMQVARRSKATLAMR